MARCSGGSSYGGQGEGHCHHGGDGGGEGGSGPVNPIVQGLDGVRGRDEGGHLQCILQGFRRIQEEDGLALPPPGPT